LKTKPSILLVDGNGILHPYRCGLASQAGLTLGIPTIGVAKTLLYGEVSGSSVIIDKEQRGYAYSSRKGRNPVFVSPGHRVSLPTSLDVVEHLSVYKHPEPLRLAHHCAKEQLSKSR
jgi:deoxyribonuclease V